MKTTVLSVQVLLLPSWGLGEWFERLLLPWPCFLGFTWPFNLLYHKNIYNAYHNNHSNIRYTCLLPQRWRQRLPKEIQSLICTVWTFVPFKMHLGRETFSRKRQIPVSSFRYSFLIFAFKRKLSEFLYSEKEGCSMHEGSWQRTMWNGLLCSGCRLEMRCISELLLLLGEDQCQKFGYHAYVIFKPLILKNKDQNPFLTHANLSLG